MMAAASPRAAEAHPVPAPEHGGLERPPGGEDGEQSLLRAMGLLGRLLQPFAELLRFQGRTLQVRTAIVVLKGNG